MTCFIKRMIKIVAKNVNLHQVRSNRKISAYANNK
jgi:hypothetical protein